MLREKKLLLVASGFFALFYMSLNTIVSFSESNGTVSDETKTDTISVEIERVENWPMNTKFSVWKNHDIYSYYNQEWDKLFANLPLKSGCNIVDIGANSGDTSLNLAVAAGGAGTVVAFEMGPAIEMLKYNVRQNPNLKIDIHNVAVSNSTGIVGFQSDCEGCNGAIADLGDRNKVTNYSISSVRLYSYLESHYSESFIDNICMIKTDTEGHDTVILSDLDEKLRPPIIWTEWYRHYKFITYDIDNETFLMEDEDYCTKESAQLFETATKAGYEIFKPKWPLRKVKGCAVKYYEQDLLLLEKTFLIKYYNETGQHFKDEGYEIKVYPES